ncbi:rhoptry-associated protein 2 [Plasmodium brasilianum]|uniref:Rhoptry-associated protein 2 n=1 Tax=Plasmodium brasilianum TaxID=5824 RepID=A0ACB9YF03_PLABR|nr:rhoptry-associated protein 2 [Plasmodium brasilianum]
MSSITFQDFTLSSIIHAHTSTGKNLGSWIHFFFSHFNNGNDAIKYVETTNINTLDEKDHHCFIRGFTVFLIHAYAKDIKAMSNTDNFETYFRNLLKDINPDIAKDFLTVLDNKILLDHMDSIILKEQDYANLKRDVNIFKQNINPVNGNNHATYKNVPTRLFEPYEIRAFKREYITKDEASINANEVYAARDYQYLAFLGVVDHYYNSDITKPAKGTSVVIESRKRLGLRKRSSSLALLGPHENNPFFGFCEKNGNEEYFGSLDDLLPSFFSIIKTKMLLGHNRFLREFDYSLMNKTYKIPNLKGFRFLKQLFRKKNLENFVDMYAGLMSTELDFLREDFLDLFDTTINCHAREFANRAGDNYFAIKEKNMVA